MDLTYIAKTDFNSDGEFSECELDVAWATLQVKKLLELSEGGPISIGSSNFNVNNSESLLDAVKAMVAVNVSASIAAGGCKVPSSLPVELEVAIGQLKLSDVLGYWRLNEAGPDIDKTNNNKRAIAFPVFDSSNSKKDGTAEKTAWLKSDNNSKSVGIGLDSWSNITIPDPEGKILSNNNDWTFHVKAYVEHNIAFKIEKGEFKIAFNPMLTNKLFAKTASGGKSFTYPDGTSWQDFKGTFIDLFLMKEGDYLKLKILDGSNATFDFGQVKVGQGVFDSSSVNSNIVIAGAGVQTNQGTIHPRKTGNAFLSEIYVTKRAEPVLSKNFYMPAKFRLLHNGDADFTEYGSSSYLDKRTSESLTVNGSLTIKKGLQSSGSYSFVNVNKNNYLSYNNFDLTQDFTLSFYYRRLASAPQLVSILDGSGKGLALTITDKLYHKFESTSGSKLNKSVSIGSDKNAWHHITIVKNNGRIAYFFDGEPVSQGFVLQYKSGSNVGTDKSLDTGLTNCTLKIGGSSKHDFATGISDLCLIQGGVIRVDSAWDVNKSNYSASDNSTILKIKDRSYFA